MVFVSVTRLHLRSLRYFPLFAWYALTSTRQVQHAPGFLAGQLASEKLRGFWTITAWTDEAAVQAYRNTGAHRRAMPKLLHWCDEASVMHWQQDTSELPEISEAVRRMVAEGRLSKVMHPSPAHAAKRIPAQQPLPGPRLRPATKRI